MTSEITLTSIERADDPLVADARHMLVEYAESLGVDLSFQGFGQELSDFPARYLPRPGRSSSPIVTTRSPAAWPCAGSRAKSAR